VRQAWSAIDHSSWRGQLKAGPTLALVTALRRAHDAAGTPVYWPTPQEAQEELRRAKKRRGGTRDGRSHRREDGGDGRSGGHGGGNGHGGGGDSHHRRGGGNSGGGGSASGGGDSRHRAHFGRGHHARISGEVTAVADAASGEVVGDDGTVLGVATLTVQP